MQTRKLWGAAVLLMFCALLQACGGGGADSSASTTPAGSSTTGSTPSGSTGSAATTPNTPAPTPTPAQTFATNALQITVDKGVSGNAINRPFINVTICEPGSTTACLTIDHVLLDTGSAGFRITYPEISGKLNLPVVVDQSGATLAECFNFAAGYMWGSVREADVYLGNLKASKIRIHAAGDATHSVANIPSSCSSIGTQANLTRDGARAIIGVSDLIPDCGTNCATIQQNNVYYYCSSGSCQSTALTTQNQVINPVSALPTDNNGTMITLPSISDAGETSVKGTLTLGIGTRDNNQLGNAKIFPLHGRGTITVNYKGTNYESRIDTGTPTISFLDNSIPLCTTLPRFYCPASQFTIIATAPTSNNAVSGTLTVRVANAELARSNVVAYNLGSQAAPPIGGSATVPSFSWGLPFFYGKSVFTAISTTSTPAGPGPYYAF